MFNATLNCRLCAQTSVRVRVETESIQYYIAQ